MYYQLSEFENVKLSVIKIFIGKCICIKMNKNYKYYYPSNNLAPYGSGNGVGYDDEYNQDYESEEYYEPSYDSQSSMQRNYTEIKVENIPKPRPQPIPEQTQSVPKASSKLPYCIVPVLYVPKRIVQREEIARNRVLRNSLASLSRMENLFHKYKANYENDATKPAPPTQDVDASAYQHPNVNVPDYSVQPNAYMDNGYYDSQYEDCTSCTNYDNDYNSNYRKQKLLEPISESYANMPAYQNIQAATPNYNYMYNYETEIDTTMGSSNLRSNPYMMDTATYNQQENDMNHYPKEDWLTSQNRKLLRSRLQMKNNIASPSGSFSKTLKNSQTNTIRKLLSLHSVGTNTIIEYDNKTSQTSGPTLPGYGEKRSILCEMATQTDPENYVTTVTHRIRSPTRYREKSDYLKGSNEVMQANPTRSATMIPKLIPVTPLGNANESPKTCLHERNSCDSRQRSCYHKPLRSLSPECARKFWK